MTRRLVLIDDNHTLRKMYARVLDGHEQFDVVGQASDGLEGLEVVAACAPDIVIVDLTMPEMDGIDCARELARRDPDLPVVILTGHASTRVTAQAREAGAVATVVKSSSDALVDTLLAVELPDSDDDRSA